MKRNIYQLAREQKGITQEKAAELLDISTKTLREYELGYTIPAGKRVADMIDIYDTQWLAYKHLKNTDENNALPELKMRTLEGASLNLLKELKDVVNMKDEILDITSDGCILEDEEETFNKIIKELEELMGATITFKYCNFNNK